MRAFGLHGNTNPCVRKDTPGGIQVSANSLILGVL